MAGLLCTLAVINIAMETASIILNLVYGIWALFAKWFNKEDSEDLDKLKKTMESIELYVKTVEYSSLAMIPIQIIVILLVRCWCSECSRCRNKLVDKDVEFNNNVRAMNMKRAEFTL